MEIQAREATDLLQGACSGLGPLADDGTGGTSDTDGSKTDKDIPEDDEE